MDLRPDCPQRYASLMPPARRSQLAEQKQRSVSLASQLSSVSNASSTTSDFIEDQVRLLQNDIDYHTTYFAGLLDLGPQKILSEEEIQDARNRTMDAMGPLFDKLNYLKRSRRGFEEDVEDEATRTKQQRVLDDGPSIELLERAYTSILHSRVMEASARQKKSNFKQREFRASVLKYYGARKVYDDGDGREPLTYCHLTGWWVGQVVKAAHLVPKSISGNELTFLFGSDEVAAMHDPRNGLSLHKNIEQGLDNGTIAIVPVPSEQGQRTRWKCLLVNTKLRSQTVCDRYNKYGSPEEEYKWQDLHDKEINFLTDHRPARRFLYFRFIMTYLQARNNGNTDFLKTLETKTTFWASPGEYLRRSTLVSVARNISGLELPPSIYTNTTFDDVGGDSRGEAPNPLHLAHTLRQALVGSYKCNTVAAGVDDNEVDDEDDDDDDEDDR